MMKDIAVAIEYAILNQSEKQGLTRSNVVKVKCVSNDYILINLVSLKFVIVGTCTKVRNI